MWKRVVVVGITFCRGRVAPPLKYVVPNCFRIHLNDSMESELCTHTMIVRDSGRAVTLTDLSKDSNMDLSLGGAIYSHICRCIKVGPRGILIYGARYRANVPGRNVSLGRSNDRGRTTCFRVVHGLITSTVVLTCGHLSSTRLACGVNRMGNVSFYHGCVVGSSAPRAGPNELGPGVMNPCSRVSCRLPIVFMGNASNAPGNTVMGFTYRPSYGNNARCDNSCISILTRRVGGICNPSFIAMFLRNASKGVGRVSIAHGESLPSRCHEVNGGVTNRMLGAVTFTRPIINSSIVTGCRLVGVTPHSSLVIRSRRGVGVSNSGPLTRLIRGGSVYEGVRTRCSIPLRFFGINSIGFFTFPYRVFYHFNFGIGRGTSTPGHFITALYGTGCNCVPARSLHYPAICRNFPNTDGLSGSTNSVVTSGLVRVNGWCCQGGLGGSNFLRYGETSRGGGAVSTW